MPSRPTRSIYLDHHASTPLCAEAAAAMRAAIETGWANPASVHREGRLARASLEGARRALAVALDADAAGIVFTSGGTEACNLGISGLALEGIRRIVTTTIEHPAVAEAVTRHKGDGVTVVRWGVRADEPFDVEAFATQLGGADTLVAVQWVNHETGIVLPAPAIVQRARDRGARVFVDATQAAGKLSTSLRTLDADAVAVASHKIGGPAGAGALVLRRGVELRGSMVGGSQERGRRAGSPDVVALVGFGAAATTLAGRVADMPRLAALRDRIEAALRAEGATPNAGVHPRVATVSNVSLPGRLGAAFVAALDLEGVSASAGSACSSGLAGPSPVIRALHPDAPERASSSLRLSLGIETTGAEIDDAILLLGRVLRRSADLK